MKNFMKAVNVDLQEIVISDVQEGIFYSKLICHTENDIIEIDSRTSDALALAVRFGCPIYIYEDVLKKLDKQDKRMNEPAFSPEPEEPEKSSALASGNLSRMSLEELEQLLQEVLDQEDYIRAIAIRDEINKRK
jgi:bifunctional DNase/RNase